MKFLARLVSGDVALWCVFWLIGTPLALLWDFSGGCMLAGCGVGEPVVAGSLIALFTLSSLALVLVSVAIWRSASKYPRGAWWRWAIVIGAKFCALYSGLTAALSFFAVLYLAFTYICAAVFEG